MTPPENAAFPDPSPGSAPAADPRVDLLLRASGQVFYEYDCVNATMRFHGDVERLLDAPVSELDGNWCRWISRVHPDDLHLLDAINPQSPEGTAHRVEYRICFRDGTPRWLRDTGCVVKDPVTGGVMIAGALVDCAGERVLLTQLQQLQKMHLFGDFAGEIGHDFNNLLTIFQGYTEIIQDDIGPEHPMRPFLDEISGGVNRARDLNAQLLSFRRAKPGEASLTSVASTLRQMSKMLRRIVGANIELAITVEEDGAWVVADPRQIETVVLNLVANARDAMPEKGRLGIELKESVIRANDRRVRDGWKPGKYVELTVSDTGTGMDESTLNRAFEPYFTTKPMRLGSGLGLSTCWQIVEQCGGRITVESTLGEGSTFTVYLPRASALKLDSAREIEPACSKIPAGNGEKIVLAEDDAQVRSALEALLTRLGYTVLCASNGDEALRVLEKNREIRLVIADLIMPLMGGSELAQALRHWYPEIKLILISGYLESLDNRPCDPYPALFLPKPLSKSVLAHKIRELIDA